MKSDFPEQDLTRDEIHDRVQWLKARAREGAKTLHSRATNPAKGAQVTDTESAAIARAKIDRSQP